MLARSVYVGLVLLVAGCGHHPVGRPPTPADIAEINDFAAGDPAGMRLYAGERERATDPVRPIPDAPPRIRRILSADEHQLTVATDAGDVWLIEMEKVAGVAIRSRRPGRAALAGGAAGLGVGAVLALGELVFSGPGPDAQVTATPGPHPLPVALAVGTLIGFTVAGAVAGILIDRHSPASDTFGFGGGR